MTKKTTKEYDSVDVRYVLKQRNTTKKSIRQIAKDTNIPKSVIGRWVKEDKMVYIRKYDFRDVRRQVSKKLSQKDIEVFMKLEHRILKEPIGRQSELTIEWYDDDDGESGYYSAVSG
jgi:hypothetical protein